MNREAVALGTPVCTTFEGRLGAVDERAHRRGPAAPPRATPTDVVLDAPRERERADAARARVRRDPALTRVRPACVAPLG